VLDFFAGSGTTGMAAHECDRAFVLIDNNPQAIAIMKERFQDVPNVDFTTTAASGEVVAPADRRRE
jgi:site-specific DNA-methyltransferase (adenine-specific)